MKNHVIVCGFGRNGSKACEELRKSGVAVVVIDSNEEVGKHPAFTTNKPLIFVPGEATQDDILELSEIHKAIAVVTTLPKDADNVFVTLTAKQLNPKVKVIARASEESSIIKLQRAGADKIVMPEAIGGSHMATLVTKPDVVEFIEMLNGVGPDALRLDELSFSDLKPEYQERSIGEMDIRRKTGATVIAVKGRTGFTMNPTVDFRMNRDQAMMVLGTEEQLKKLQKEYLD